MKNEEEIETINNEEISAISHETSTENSDDVSQGAKSDEDISFEEVNEEGEVDVKTTIKKLREKIKKLESEKQEYLDLSQRTRADYANFKKEVESNRAMDRKFATKRFIEELFPVLDGYDMAKGNVESWEKVDSNWRVGIEYIFGQLRSVLEKEGVEQFGKIGDEFNPALHESMEMVNVTNEDENGKLVKVLQSGYRMNDTVIRPARVHVGHNETA